ncbi:hypothetical protein WMY93_013970 [Mugilogobius chulae]|uniref:Uncharacterized protein n=1 Tax=Mugilogobius chulae TaxID=88201 RepID=A0AAW0P4Y3_9GOBI
MLNMFLTGCMVFNALLLLTAFLCFLMRIPMQFTLAEGLKSGMRFYKDTDTPGRCYMKRTIDLMQMEFRCCGTKSFRDWFEIQWVSNRYLDFSAKEVRDRIGSNVDGQYLMDGVRSAALRPLHRGADVWKRGCSEALLSYYGGMMNTIGALVILVTMSGSRWPTVRPDFPLVPGEPRRPGERERGLPAGEEREGNVHDIMAKMKSAGKGAKVEEEERRPCCQLNHTAALTHGTFTTHCCRHCLHDKPA